MTDQKKYQVALSFAGEDREYVEKVARDLREKGIKVFYDEYHEVDLWGKDLAIHLNFIYGENTAVVIIFISQYYIKKIYPMHELSSALATAIKLEREYILPAKFDQTQIPGIPDTTKYIDLKSYSSEDFADLIIKKLAEIEKNSTIRVRGTHATLTVERKVPDVKTQKNPETNCLQITGLTDTDNRILEVICRKSLINDFPKFVNTQEILEIAIELGINEEDFYDTIEILDNRGFIAANKMLGGEIPDIEIFVLTLEEYCRHCINNYESLSHTVISTILTQKKDKNMEISSVTKIQVSIVNHILQYLETMGKIRITTTLDGMILIHPSNFAELKRML